MRLKELSLLLEKRKHEQYFPKKTTQQTLEEYKDQDVYVSFQDVNKLGINPSMHKKWPNILTPLGVYAFPINYVLEDNGLLIQDIFFRRKYIYVLTAKEHARILHLDTFLYNKNQLKIDFENLVEFLRRDAREDFISDFSEIYKSNTNGRPFTTLRIIYQQFARNFIMKINKSHFLDTADSKLSANIFFKKALKYDAILDTEHFFVNDLDEQMIFLSTNAFDIEDALINPRQKKFWESPKVPAKFV